MHNFVINETEIAKMRAQLLGWYDARGRELPWRRRPQKLASGEYVQQMADPYPVWLSEIMLQQTTVAHATPYWEKFLSEFPSVADLAAAPRDQVLTLWAGLGYYARARNLHKCAQIIVADHDGTFPVDEAALLKLPGIGPYTAATIAALCHGQVTNIVDGNVERVMSRLTALEKPLPAAKPDIRKIAAQIALTKLATRPGDYGQALMDLGATICMPKNPDCSSCVWQNHCRAFAKGNMEHYPRKAAKKKLPIRYGAVFWLEHQGSVLIRQRPDQGLLGGMMEFPGTVWAEDEVSHKDWLADAPIHADWQRLEPSVTHIFTHFQLELILYKAKIEGPRLKRDGIWADIDNLGQYALPSVMKKVAKVARD